jgi:hypothetical protein
MSLEKIREYCLSLPHATEEVLWQKDLVFKIGGKMFLETGRDQAVDQGFLPDGEGEVAEEDSGAAWLTPLSCLLALLCDSCSLCRCPILTLPIVGVITI